MTIYENHTYSSKIISQDRKIVNKPVIFFSAGVPFAAEEQFLRK